MTVNMMQTIAEQRCGKCLSKKYTNTNTKLKWQCAEGHMWFSAPKDIKRGTWCPKCGKVRSWKKRREKYVKS